MPLRQLYPPGSTAPGNAFKVDFVAVHGLNPTSKDSANHAWDTWRTPDGDSGRLWLRDDLPEDAPGSRIFLYEYEATALYGSDRTHFIEKANKLLNEIRMQRRDPKAKHRPIIFLGHSMGGLLIKQALINAHNNPAYTSIRDSTTGLAFFATPHHGGDWKWVSVGSVASKIATSLGFQKGDDVLETLRKGSIFSGIQEELWRHQLLRYKIISFRGTRDSVVPLDSAKFGMPGDREEIVDLMADHSGVCKFGTNQTEQDNLRAVCDNIGELYQAALEIDIANNQPSLSAAALSTPLKSYRDLPYSPRYKKFVGRESVMNTIEERLFGDDACQRVAIVGLGGVGKTRVALQIAYRLRPEWSVFWLPAISISSFEQACRKISQKLGLEGAENGNAKEVLHHYLESVASGRWLLIVDNADDEDVMKGEDHAINNFFSNLSEQGRILFTTRDLRIGVRLVQSQVVSLSPMNAEEGKELFEKSLADKSRLTDGQSVRELLEVLTYLPLAIIQAAAYLNETPPTTVSKYTWLLQNTEIDMVQLLETEFADDTRYPPGDARYPGAQNAVAKTWVTSFKQVQKNADAAMLLSFISQVNFEAIPQFMLPAVGTEQRMTRAIGVLCGYSFLRTREDRSTYDMHRLVHMASRVWLATQQSAGDQRRMALKHLAKIFSTDEWEKRETWRHLLPHVMTTVKDVQGRNGGNEEGHLGYWIGRCLLIEGRSQEAVTVLEGVVAIRETALAETHPRLLVSQHALAGAYHTDGRVKEAITLLERVVAIRETALADTHPHRLASQHALAVAYQADGRVKEAITLLERVVAIRETALADTHPHRLASQHTLAVAYQADGRVKEAITLLERVVAIRKTALSHTHPHLLESQHGLARAYHADGQVKEAITLLEQVVAIKETALANTNSYLLVSQHALAVAYQADGRVKEAITLLERVVAIRETVLADTHPHLIASQHTLAVAYQADGRVKEAIPLLERVAIEGADGRVIPPRRTLTA